MKIETLKKRLQKNRPITTTTITIPEDVLEELKLVASLSGFSSYEALIKSYIGKGLRQDIERLDSSNFFQLIESLKRHGVEESVINNVLAEIRH